MSDRSTVRAVDTTKAPLGIWKRRTGNQENERRDGAHGRYVPPKTLGKRHRRQALRRSGKTSPAPHIGGAFLSGAMIRPLLARCLGFDGEGVQAARQLVRQQAVHQTMPRQTALASKGLRDNTHAKMRELTGTMTAMTFMPMTLILEFENAGREFGQRRPHAGQPLGDRIVGRQRGNGRAHARCGTPAA